MTNANLCVKLPSLTLIPNPFGGDKPFEKAAWSLDRFVQAGERIKQYREMKVAVYLETIKYVGDAGRKG